MKSKEKERALKLREKGMSYSQILKEVNVSKGTLSNWLRDFPLSKKRIQELRDHSEERIEKYRATMKKKRDDRHEQVYKKVADKISNLDTRDLFIAGLFLYWGEGGKTQWTQMSMSNTDPAIMKFFLKWLDLFGIDQSKLRIRLQLYSDMNERKEKRYWSKILCLPLCQFRKSYIKQSKQSDISHAVRHRHGTCNIYYGNRDLAEEVLLSLQYLQDIVHTD